MQLFFAALFEDPQNVSRVTEIEAGERIEEWQDAMEQRVFGGDGSVINQTERSAIGGISLTEPVILQIESAVIIESGAPEHGAMIHHTVINPANNVIVTETACLFRHPEIAGVHETDEFGRFVIEPNV